jgi:hypothetical protein
MNPDVRKELLRLVEVGNDLEAACSLAGVKPAVVRADKALMAEVHEAFVVATAKLRGQLLQRLLADDGDDKILAQALERREQAQAAMAQAADVGGAASDRRKQMIDDLMREVEAHAVIHKANLRREIEAELKAEGRLREIEILPPPPKPKSQPSLRDLATLDAGESLPWSRSVAAYEPPPEPCGRSVGRPRALSDPGSPWFTGER